MLRNVFKTLWDVHRNSIFVYSKYWTLSLRCGIWAFSNSASTCPHQEFLVFIHWDNILPYMYDDISNSKTTKQCIGYHSMHCICFSSCNCKFGFHHFFELHLSNAVHHHYFNRDTTTISGAANNSERHRPIQCRTISDMWCIISILRCGDPTNSTDLRNKMSKVMDQESG